MSKEEEKAKKEANKAYKNVAKNVQVWVSYELKEVDKRMESMIGFVKKLNPEDGGKTVMTKEDYDEILVKRDEMNTLIERVKKLEAEANERAGDEQDDRESSRQEKEESGSQKVNPESATENVNGEKRTSATAAAPIEKEPAKVTGGQPNSIPATTGGYKAAEKFKAPSKSFQTIFRND